MRSYLLAQAADAINNSEQSGWRLGGLAAVWAVIQGKFAGFAVSDALVWMSLLWFADFFLGSLVALRDSWIGGPNRWAPSRVAKSVAKWSAWFVALALTHAVRQQGFGPISTCVEAAILLSEATSVIRNAGILTGRPWVSKFASGLERLEQAAADRAEEALDKIGANGRANQ